MATSTKKLKTSDIFKVKSGAFRSALKRYADFVNAPHIVDTPTPTNGDISSLPEQRGWWFSESSNTSLSDRGLSQSLDYIKTVLEEQGPFHGLVGFSQGAAFGALVCDHLSQLESCNNQKIQFAILIAGFANDFVKAKISSAISTNVLLVIGDNDKIIPRSMSEELLPYLNQVDVLYHPGGHGIPLGSEQKKTFRNFLILCLHGYRQSEQSFREKTGGFRKSLKKFAEFYFCNAPHRVCIEQGGEDANCLGWWFSREDNYYKAVEYSEIDKGFQESVEYIKQVFQDQGPFDGILAFSQGACFLTMLCHLKEYHELDIRFDFVMLFAGFRSRCSPHEKFYTAEEPIRTPALITIGEADEVIPLEMGLEVVKYFSDPVVLKHPGGHFIPNQPDQRQVYSQFLESRLKKKREG